MSCRHEAARVKNGNKTLGSSPIKRRALAARLTLGSSLNGAIVSSVVKRACWTAHSSFCSSMIRS
jgi:hypothetical protein